MNIKDIPLIIPNFQQLTYLRNLINWWKWYYPENDIVIVDNGSDYLPLIHYYSHLQLISGSFSGRIYIERFKSNDFINNLNSVANSPLQEKYILISDPDIMPHPATPPNFLEIFKHAIDHYNYHHAGFDLMTDDIPDWNKKKAWIQGDEKALHGSPVNIEFEGVTYQGYRAPLDSTFCLYKRSNGGWYSPMDGKDWGNSLRLFNSFHLPFYLDANRLNPEMQHYYATCLRHDVTKPATGRAHFIPEK